MRSGTLWVRLVTTFYRRAILMARDLESLEAASAEVPARIAPLAPGEIDAYLRFRADARRGDLEARFAREDAAVVAWLDDRIVHAAWVATGRAPVAYLRRDLVLEPDELLVYDSHTMPEFRESGIAKARMEYVFREYRRRGYRRCFAIVAAENEIGRRAVESGGYRAVGRYDRILVGPLDRCWRAAATGPRMPQLADPRAE